MSRGPVTITASIGVASALPCPCHRLLDIVARPSDPLRSAPFSGRRLHPQKPTGLVKARALAAASVPPPHNFFCHFCHFCHHHHHPTRRRRAPTLFDTSPPSANRQPANALVHAHCLNPRPAELPSRARRRPIDSHTHTDTPHPPTHKYHCRPPATHRVPPPLTTPS
jgi:hypothetical protein